LSEALVQASGRQQTKLLQEYQENAGTAYTQALARAIPDLSGGTRQKARDALAVRLSAMTPKTLRSKLQDDDLEVRRAAALACAMKEEKSLVPDVIPLLEDPEPPVARAAHVALKELTRQDFGPEADASRADRAKSVARWKAWWEKQEEKDR
jgi:HEAT repeat protein